ncbi:MAG TPA: hypothetical protein VL400_02520, partial [Polyangiaceae bacterium]|nr:hypothetical protein [Polyangiaceae bacterium]
TAPPGGGAQPSTGPTTSPTTSLGVEPLGTATAPASSGTIAPTMLSPTLPPPGAPSTDDLREDEGYLRVEGPATLAVYLNGHLAGQTAEWIRTQCGIRYVRFARRDPPQPGASFPKWLDDGASLMIPCRGATTVTAPTQ